MTAIQSLIPLPWMQLRAIYMLISESTSCQAPLSCNLMALCLLSLNPFSVIYKCHQEHPDLLSSSTHWRLFSILYTPFNFPSRHTGPQHRTFSLWGTYLPLNEHRCQMINANLSSMPTMQGPWPWGYPIVSFFLTRCSIWQSLIEQSLLSGHHWWSFLPTMLCPHTY